MFIILLFLAAILASLIAFPLCLIATNFQSAYSISVSLIILMILSFIAFRQIKKQGARKSLAFITKFIIIALGLASFFVMVTSGRRIFAIMALVLSAVLFMLASKFLEPKNTELKTEK